jgi:hypothetical protein
MAIGIAILAVVLALLLSTAAIVIPRVVARRNNPEDHEDSQAYLASTGRSAQEIVQDNRGSQPRPGNDAGSSRPEGTDADKSS